MTEKTEKTRFRCSGSKCPGHPFPPDIVRHPSSCIAEGEPSSRRQLTPGERGDVHRVPLQDPAMVLETEATLEGFAWRMVVLNGEATHVLLEGVEQSLAGAFVIGGFSAGIFSVGLLREEGSGHVGLDALLLYILAAERSATRRGDVPHLIWEGLEHPLIVGAVTRLRSRPDTEELIERLLAGSDA